MSPEHAKELVSRPGGMDAAEAEAFLDLLMTGELAEAEGAGLLVALAERGETATELAAFVRGLRARCTKVAGPSQVLDLCGTGGSGLTRFNISTTAAFILAAAGVPVAKHGNRGSKRPNGSFDLLDELAIPFTQDANGLASLLSDTGLVFLFARSLHPTVAAVVPYRKAAGRRTIFNLAGPLANPVGVSHQLIGCCDDATRAVVAGALAALGTERALVVTGEPGIDEFSVTGASRYTVVTAEGASEAVIDTPAHPNLDYSALPGGDAPENAQTCLALLKGEETGPLLDMLCLNAGAAIDCFNGRTVDPNGDGVQQARQLVSDGSALAKLEAYRAQAQSLG